MLECSYDNNSGAECPCIDDADEPTRSCAHVDGIVYRPCAYVDGDVSAHAIGSRDSASVRSGNNLEYAHTADGIVYIPCTAPLELSCILSADDDVACVTGKTVDN